MNYSLNTRNATLRYVTKTVHHQKFLEECQEKRIMLKGLQLKLTLNIMDQDRGLESKIQGILIQAELEIYTGRDYKSL